jgi:hypothetical protein
LLLLLLLLLLPLLMWSLLWLLVRLWPLMHQLFLLPLFLVPPTPPSGLPTGVYRLRLRGTGRCGKPRICCPL